MQDSNLIPLQNLYLLAIATALQSDQFDSVLQDLSDEKMKDTGRIWFVRKGTTVPDGSIAFQFERDAVNLGVITRDERQLARVVRYAEGLDGFLEELAKFLHAGRLAAPTKRSSRSRTAEGRVNALEAAQR